MSDNFPLCRALGLLVQDQNEKQCERWTVRAADLEALLAKAPVVRVGKYSDKSLEYFTSHPGSGDYTHTALLVNVQPIVRDTAEGLLKEIERLYMCNSTDTVIRNLGGILDRAKKLLGEEGL